MTYSIRPFAEKDRRAVREICLDSALRKPRTEARRLYLFLTTCDYYLDCEPENCFVAEAEDADGTRTIVGYILCAEDCETFARRYMDKYMPRLKQYGKLTAYSARTDIMVVGRFAAFFPAHIRLAVVPSAQRQGVGAALVQTLREHLSARKGKGILAIVEKRNSAAMQFFPAVGFSVLQTFGAGVAFGMDL